MTPARCAALPAAARMTSNPFSRARSANAATFSGVRCALATCTSTSTPNARSTFTQPSSAGQSLFDPMMSAALGINEHLQKTKSRIVYQLPPCFSIKFRCFPYSFFDIVRDFALHCRILGAFSHEFRLITVHFGQAPYPWPICRICAFRLSFGAEIWYDEYERIFQATPHPRRKGALPVCLPRSKDS